VPGLQPTEAQAFGRNLIERLSKEIIQTFGKTHLVIKNIDWEYLPHWDCLSVFAYLHDTETHKVVQVRRSVPLVEVMSQSSDYLVARVVKEMVDHLLSLYPPVFRVVQTEDGFVPSGWNECEDNPIIEWAKFKTGSKDYFNPSPLTKKIFWVDPKSY